VCGATGTIISDPKFTNSVGNDLTLQSSSPAIDAGLNLGATYQLGLAPGSVWTSAVSTLNQNNYGAGWEIGAYVYIAPNQAPVIQSSPWANPNPVTLPSTTLVSVLASDPDNGPAPLMYTWSLSSGPVGGMVSFAPNGTTGSNSSTASFSMAGSYVLRATVSDGTASVTTDVTVTVNPAPPPNLLHVAGIAMSVAKVGNGKTATARVSIANSSGAPVNGATVTGSWSGLTNGSASGTTGTNGMVALTSAKSRQTGTFTFTITNVVASGYTYDSTKNVATSASITTTGVVTSAAPALAAESISNDSIQLGGVSVNQTFKLPLPLPANLTQSGKLKSIAIGLPKGTRVVRDFIGGRIRESGTFTLTVQFTEKAGKGAAPIQASQQYTITVAP
jgi:hypothetical protein